MTATCMSSLDHDYDCSTDSTFLFCRKCGDVVWVEHPQQQDVAPTNPLAGLDSWPDHFIVEHVAQKLNDGEWALDITQSGRMKRFDPSMIEVMSIPADSGLHIHLHGDWPND